VGRCGAPTLSKHFRPPSRSLKSANRLMAARCASPSTSRAIRAEMWSTRSLFGSGRTEEAMKAVTTSERMSSSDLGGGSYRAELGEMEPVALVAGIVPLHEALVPSTSPSPSPSRLTRERLFCPKADEDGPKAGRLGMVIGFGSTYIVTDIRIVYIFVLSYKSYFHIVEVKYG